MKETFNKYIRHRHLERVTGAVNGRINIKADLAHSINKGEGQWYLDRLARHAPGTGMTYGEFASQLSDGNIIKTRREPSLAESVIATAEREKIYDEVKEKILPKVKCLVKVGSTGWAENYDVRGGDDPSDIDLEVLVDEVNEDLLDNFPKGREGMKLYKHYYDQGLVDYFSFGFKQGNVPVSIHMVPASFFQSNCLTDYKILQNDKLAREFRIKPKSKPPIYHDRYDGFGNKFPYKCHPKSLPEGGQVTETPIMMVREGNIVMGLLMSKHFTYPPVEGDVSFYERNLYDFKVSLAERLAKDGGNFSQMPARKERMPYYILEQLDKEQQWITENY